MTLWYTCTAICIHFRVRDKNASILLSLFLVRTLLISLQACYVTLVIFTGSSWIRWCSGHARTVWTQGILSALFILHFNMPHFIISIQKYIFEACTKGLWLSLCAPQGDRGFDGLAGLPGEKGHRVSHFVVLWKLCVCVCFDVCHCSTWICVVAGRTWTQWTSWWSWRGWREGKWKKTTVSHLPFMFSPAFSVFLYQPKMCDRTKAHPLIIIIRKLCV